MRLEDFQVGLTESCSDGPPTFTGTRFVFLGASLPASPPARSTVRCRLVGRVRGKEDDTSALTTPVSEHKAGRHSNLFLHGHRTSRSSPCLRQERRQRLMCYIASRCSGYAARKEDKTTQEWWWKVNYWGPTTVRHVLMTQRSPPPLGRPISDASTCCLSSCSSPRLQLGRRRRPCLCRLHRPVSSSRLLPASCCPLQRSPSL